MLVLLQQIPPDVPFVVPVTDPNQALFRVGPFVTWLVAAAIIPSLVSLLTRYNAHPFIKFAMNLVLSAIAGAINVAINLTGEAVFSKGLVITTVMQVVFSLMAYEHLLKPSLDINARLAPDFGLGPRTQKVPQDVRRALTDNDDALDTVVAREDPPTPLL